MYVQAACVYTEIWGWGLGEFRRCIRSDRADGTLKGVETSNMSLYLLLCTTPKVPLIEYLLYVAEMMHVSWLEQEQQTKEAIRLVSPIWRIIYNGILTLPCFQQPAPPPVLMLRADAT